MAAPAASALPRRRELRPSSARSLLLTVLGEYVLPNGEPVWTGTLVTALGLLGIAEKAARQALARTAAEGWIASSKHGRLARWQLTEAGRRLLSEGAQRIYSFGQDGPAWDGRWLIVLVAASDLNSQTRHRVRTRLMWAGFGALPGGVWVSPDPGREAEASQILEQLGLADAAMSFTGRFGSIGAQQRIVSRAWDLSAVEARYDEFIAEFTELRPVTDKETLAAQTLLVHEWRRFPFLDPRLPRDLLPAGWPGADAAALFSARHAQWSEAASHCWRRLAANEPSATV
jgi:phenylacetic acid degradation operon negative regulatory protein